jgi:hypothetical protein
MNILYIFYIFAHSTKKGCLIHYIFISTQNVSHILIRHVCSNTSNNVHDSLYFFCLKNQGVMHIQGDGVLKKYEIQHKITRPTL